VDSNGRLIGINDPSTRKVSFNYSGNQLYTITYPDGKSTEFNSDSSNYLNYAKNYDGRKVTFNYTPSSPKRVSKVTECTNGGLLGTEQNIAYGYNTTTFTDHRGIKNVYQFDNTGKTLCVKDDDGSAGYYNYSDQSNITKTTSSSKLQKSVMNLLYNSSAEYDRNFNPAMDGGSGSLSYTTESSYMGSRSLKVTKSDNITRAYYDQTVWLEKGKTYTYSAYVQTSNISKTYNGQGAYIVAHYKRNDGSFEENSRSTHISGTNDWTRLEVTFTVPLDSTDNNVILRAGIEDESGIAYFDALQLEEGTTANRYNLIENGDFNGDSQIPFYWGNQSCTAQDSRITSSSEGKDKILNSQVFKMTGAYRKDSRFTQAVNVNGNIGDTYVIGAW
jgi:hypothetical protein